MDPQGSADPSFRTSATEEYFSLSSAVALFTFQALNAVEPLFFSALSNAIVKPSEWSPEVEEVASERRTAFVAAH